MATGREVAGRRRDQASGFRYVKFEIPNKLPGEISSRELNFEAGGQVRSGQGT